MMPPEFQRRLYREMLRIRRVEERIAALYPEQEMRCPVHLCIGQEAVAVGACAALGREDYVVSTHRSHGHYLAKGGDLRAMMAELYGKATGCSRGKGGSMHLVDLSVGYLGSAPIVGSTIPIGVGAAFGAWLKGAPRVSAVFFGEGAVEEGVCHEAMNFAALKRLPVVFLCENNLYSVYSPLSVRQPEGRAVFRVAGGHGIESAQGDGNDPLEVHDLVRKAVAKARAGGGPTFLEFRTYRWREHCGPNYDHDAGYRPPGEFEEWRKLCPVERLRGRLSAEGLASAADLDALARGIEDEIDGAVAFAKSSPFPGPDELAAGVTA